MISLDRWPKRCGRSACLLGVAVTLAAGCATPMRGPSAMWIGEEQVVEFDAGPFATHDRDLADNDRIRALGPLTEQRISDRGDVFRAVRPFISTVDARALERVDVLWPLGEMRRKGTQSVWRFLTAYGTDFDVNDPDGRFRGAVFPFAFWGRSSEGVGYAAVFPVGGTIREILSRDQVTFVLFPLFVTDRVNAVTSTSILWPFISWGRGDGISRLRVFPFYGHSRNEGRWTKRFVLWPFWTRVDYAYDEDAGSGFMLFPLYGRVSTPQQETSWWLPPLFKFGRGGDDRVIHCPWPLIQISDGKVSKRYIWPLWGTKSIAHVDSGFFLWPLGHWESASTARETKTRRMVLPFIYSARTVVHAEAGEDPVISKRYWKLWPLVSYRAEDGHRLFRLLDLWPLKHTSGIERNWSPLWTLYRSEQLGESRERELLWGLYRSRQEPDGSSYVGVFPFFHRWSWGAQSIDREWSVLGGLLAGKRKGDWRQWRILYLINLSRGGAPDA